MSENDTDQPAVRWPFRNSRGLFADLAAARRTEGLTFSETLNTDPRHQLVLPACAPSA